MVRTRNYWPATACIRACTAASSLTAVPMSSLSSRPPAECVPVRNVQFSALYHDLLVNYFTNQERDRKYSIEQETCTVNAAVHAPDNAIGDLGECRSSGGKPDAVQVHGWPGR